jgi:hypothetical protein
MENQSLNVNNLNFDSFSTKEMQLILQNRIIFDNEDSDLCPKCEHNKSPFVISCTHEPCLQCIEEAFRQRAPIFVKHLPEIWPADADLIHMAHELISKYHPVASDAEIAYIMRAKHQTLNGKVKLGSCAKQPAKAKLLHEWDYVIEIAWDMWALMDDTQRESLLLHDICHIDQEDGAWKVRMHDVEEHTKVVQRYGLWKPDLRYFARAIAESEAVSHDEQMPIAFPGTGDGK